MGTKVEVFVHVVWGTLYRRQTIAAEVMPRVHRALVERSNELKCRVHAVGGTRDHVHMLVALHPAMALSRLVGELKGGSSHDINYRFAPGAGFRWQEGYAAFTVSPRDLAPVAGYVRDQERRHALLALDPRFELGDDTPLAEA